MRRTLVLFVLKLVAASALFYVVWEWQGQVWYAVLFREVALPVYGLFGITPESLREALNVTVERFYNILPFLSLMAAAWGISWRRRIIGILAGGVTILAWHIVFTAVVRGILSAHHFDPIAYRQLSPLFLFSDALPFVLWVVIAYRPLTAILGGARSSSPAATGGSEPGLIDDDHKTA